MAHLDQDQWFAAAAKGNIGAIRAMIVRGMDIDLRDSEERTAFDIAAQNSDTDLMTAILAGRKMRRLQQWGIDPFAPAVPEGLPAASLQDEGPALLRATRRA